jgi:predicted enzyme related to lactoylglutathione lyase
MGQILGVGGVFFKCRDVTAYRAWWAEHMGAALTDWGTMEYAPDGKGQTMMSPFADDSDYFGGSEARFMINLRVDDVASLIERARKGGAIITAEVETNEFGTFGWFIDPEGIKIELWQEP